MPGHLISARYWLYGPLIVDFVITHVHVGEGQASEIARIDCSHLEVHLHQFGRSGRELQRRVIGTVAEPKDVYEWWEYCWDSFAEGYPEQARRWREG